MEIRPGRRRACRAFELLLARSLVWHHPVGWPHSGCSPWNTRENGSNTETIGICAAGCVPRCAAPRRDCSRRIVATQCLPTLRGQHKPPVSHRNVVAQAGSLTARAKHVASAPMAVSIGTYWCCAVHHVPPACVELRLVKIVAPNNLPLGASAEAHHEWEGFYRLEEWRTFLERA